MTSAEAGANPVASHYRRKSLLATILAALKQDGKDPEHLRPEDLAPIDEFHIRGREATVELARAAGLQRTDHVLDVGSGVGGPSRSLVQLCGCRVTGIDLTPEYCETATALASLTGLQDRVSYRVADALSLPFEDGSFDAVWTQHVAMNIADKRQLYAEMNRVLKDGGTLAIYDVLQGPGGPIHFPVPWAVDASTSHLSTQAQLRELLRAAGFEIAELRDTTEQSEQWFAAVARRIAEQGPPALGLHVLVGPEFAAMAQNQKRNLVERRIETVQIVAKKT